MYEIKDACGNATTCEQLIVVDDTIAPEIACPDSYVCVCAGQSLLVPIPDYTGVLVTDN